MKSLVLQRVDLGSRKQRVHLAILAVFGLLLLAGVAIALVVFDPDPVGGARVFVVHKKFPVAAFGPVAVPRGVKARAWNNGSDKVYGLQLNGSTNVSVWEFYLRGAR